MNAFVTGCLFVCAAFTPNHAVPLHAKHSRSERDTFLLMPGVSSIRQSADHFSTAKDSRVSAPLLFFSGPFNSQFPESGLEQGHRDNNDNFQDEGSGALNIIGFPGQNQTPEPSPAEEDDGSGDKVYFPTAIKLDLANRDAGGNGVNCAPESGYMDFDGKCLRLLSRSSCPEGQWVVFNEQKNVDECVTRPCPTGQLLYNGKCVDILDNNVCSEGQMLYVDFTGDVHCDCLPNFFYDPWSGKCFAQGDQGYCNFGQQLVINENGVVECRKNPCLMDGYVFHNESGRCYKKLYRGFCEDGLLITYPNNGTAECQAILIRGVFDLPTLRSCRAGTLRDFAGNCRQRFRIPSSSSYPTVYGGCPPSHVKGPLGNCRKTHSLFG